MSLEYFSDVLEFHDITVFEVVQNYREYPGHPPKSILQMGIKYSIITILA